MVLRMEYTGIVVTDQDKILAFTMGLPATYEAVIINFDATSPAYLTVEHVISRLLNEETRQQSSGTTSPPDTEPNNVAFAARRTIADYTCYFCDKKGHLKADCPERLRWEECKKKSSSETAAGAVDYDSDDYDGVCSLIIDGFRLQLPTAPWTALTHLELRRFSAGDVNFHTASELSAMTTQCPLLVHLQLHICFSVIGQAQIHIPILEFLHVWIPSGACLGDPTVLELIELFDTPALTEFVVEGTHGDQIYVLFGSEIFRSSYPALTSFSFIGEVTNHECLCETVYPLEYRISPPLFAIFPALSSLTLINQCFTPPMIQEILGPEVEPWPGPRLEKVTLCPPSRSLNDVRSALKAAVNSERECEQPFPKVKLFHSPSSFENWSEDSSTGVEVFG
ncbi:hypothetical protein B0H12DRAFT_1236922 [Mycena haematopus]|nr:hypothetical protein B0H12DRAFT_1236922 [Mycena haematopus]